MSEPAEPSRKRPRLQDPAHDPIADSDLTRDGEFWLEDGSIVVVAGNTAFKVYRGLLAAQSPVFADMLASASPCADQTLERCPVVRLSDSAEDLRHFLRALLPKTQRSFFHDIKEVNFTIEQLSSIIRLSHKYQVEDLQNQGLSTLRMYFTNSFKQWESTANFPIEEPEAIAGIEVIHLATLTDTPSMLPMAMYICAAGGSSVLDGWRREDGTVTHLGKEDLKRVMDGYGKLQRQVNAFNKSIFVRSPSEACTSPAPCRLALHAIRTAETSVRTTLKLLHGWHVTKSNYDLCKACGGMLEARDVRTRHELWKKLPSLFDLTMEHWDSEFELP